MLFECIGTVAAGEGSSGGGGSGLPSLPLPLSFSLARSLPRHGEANAEASVQRGWL